MDALALSDRCLRDGASDHLLKLLIEREEENHTVFNASSHSNFRIPSNSWQYCRRLKDKQLAAKLALKYMSIYIHTIIFSIFFMAICFIHKCFLSYYRYLHRWELDAALDVLTMCHCHLLETDPSKNEVFNVIIIQI